MIRIVKYYLLFIICINFALLQDQETIYEKENLAQYYIEAGLYDDAIFVYQDIVELKKLTLLGAISNPTTHVKITSDITLGFINSNKPLVNIKKSFFFAFA